MARRPKNHNAIPDSGTGPQDDGRKRNLGDLSLIWGFARQYPWVIAGASVALILTSASTLAIPSGFRLVIDRGFAAGGASADISHWFRYLLGIVALLAIATAARFYCVSWLGERVVADMRVAVQARLLRLSPSFFEVNRPSEIASRMTSDTAIIEQVVGSTVSVALRNAFTGVGGVIYLFTLAPRLTAMLLIAIPVILIPLIVIGRRLRALARTSQDRLASIGSMTTEVLGAMKIVQAFGQESREKERFSAAVEDGFHAARHRIIVRAGMTALVIGLIFGSLVLLMWQGALDVASGRMTGGSIAAFVVTGGLVAGAFGSLSETYGDLLRAAGAASRMTELLAEQPGITAPASPIPVPPSAPASLRFEGVRFLYPTRRDTAALEDFTLHVRHGETVALVGPSGAGKSTVLQLASRFYDPDAGNILFNDVPLPAMDPVAMRGMMALVPQETVIFAASARDNLRYGRWDADDDALWAAARAAHAETFLRALPEGLDTYLGEGGARLSGGQRQRIAIARALLRDAPLLLLDEATSALDAESEHAIQTALAALMGTRTTIVIAHRLATVRAADRIVVMDGGRIVETGTHAELSARSGLYARLASLQFTAAD
ncbi:MAG TPA: ABC transporter transmembrane domain-containing protein [Sphingobium sp.]